MATVLALPRSLPAVLLDLTITKQRLTALDARIINRTPSDEEDQLWSQLDDRIAASEAEAKALILAATGASWDDCYQVLA